MTEPRIAALEALTDALGALEFGLLADRRAEVVALRDRTRKDVEGHIARLRHPEAPLLVVVGGVTGGGKSTIVNTLAGAAVAPTGVRRPTTTAPTLVCNPADLDWFSDERVLPGLRRREGRASSGGDGEPTVRLVPTSAMPAGLAVLDAPDSDSVSTDNRELADTLLDAADLWVWTTTQGKYADEDSMDLLRRARDRRTAIAVALGHVDAEHLQVVTDDFTDKLAAEGLDDVRIFAVPRSPVADEQLPEHAVYDLRAWLWSLATPEQRDALRDQTLQGALDVLPDQVGRLLDAVDEEQRTYRLLSSAAADRYRAAGTRFGELLDRGQISMREQVLRSWVDFVGTGRFQRFLQTASERARHLGRRLLTPLIDRQEQRLEQELRVEAAEAVATRVGQVADVAAGEVADEWLRHPAGRMLLDVHPGLHRSDPDLPARVADAVSAWEGELVELVETKGATRKGQAQWAGTAINATSASLILVTFGATGGLSGAEIAIAGTSATVGQLVLEKVLGSHNVRWLVAEAKRRLLQHVEAVLGDERNRFGKAAAERAPDPEHRQRVADALDQLRRSRR